MLFGSQVCRPGRPEPAGLTVRASGPDRPRECHVMGFMCSRGGKDQRGGREGVQMGWASVYVICPFAEAKMWHSHGCCRCAAGAWGGMAT